MTMEEKIQQLQVVPIPVQNVLDLPSTVERIKRFKRVVRQHVIYVVSLKKTSNRMETSDLFQYFWVY